MTNTSDVTTMLATLIDNALGASENTATRTRIHVIANIIGALGNELTPLLASHYDMNTLMDGIMRIENGLIDIENGLDTVTTALKNKSASSASLVPAS